MSEEIAFRLNTASEAELADHLVRCDAGFVPPLSSRVEIGGYAHKISTRAMRFEAWDRTLIGLLAAYCNDAGRGTAYITSVSVLEGWRGRGIAARLLEQCVDHARELGFTYVELEVDGANAGAVSLYGKSGFKIDRAQGRTLIMHLDLSKDA